MGRNPRIGGELPVLGSSTVQAVGDKTGQENWGGWDGEDGGGCLSNFSREIKLERMAIFWDSKCF